MIAAAALLALFLATNHPVVAHFANGDRVEWRRGDAPFVLVLPKQGEGWSRLAARVCGDSRFARQLQAANEGRGNPQRGMRVLVPWAILRGELRLEAARALFPQDRRVPGGWLHIIVAPWRGDGESWWEVAEWFCGDGALYPVLREANPELGLFPPKDAQVFIPESKLNLEFRRVRTEGAGKTPIKFLAPTPTVSKTLTAIAAAPPTPRPTPAALTPTPPPLPFISRQTPVPTPGAALESQTAVTLTSTPVATTTPAPSAVPVTVLAEPPAPVVSPSPFTMAVTPVLTPAPVEAGETVLEFLGDDAIYKLRAGEALYSAVVVRFTGQIHAADVNATAADIAKRSGITNVTTIRVGYAVRIPVDQLLPEFLPANHPRRLEYEREREELAGIKRTIRAAKLSGIHVILDAGHGGGDTGAIADGIWESTYVYDVMNRVRRVLQDESKATVWAVVRDDTFGAEPPQLDQLPNNRLQRLLVDPPYDLSDPSVGVNLRWILSNSLVERLRKQKVNPERVVFVSIHADSLHPAVRGMMVYVPSRQLRGRTSPFPQGQWDCRETREMKPPRFNTRFSSRAEALSTELGEAIVHAAAKYGVAVHPYQPVRSAVLRGGSRWVPAVLKYSLVPNAVLVEICNMNNEQDRSLLLNWKFRERLAHTIAAGLAEDFSK